MNTFVELRKIRCYAYHGVAEQERCVGNDYEIYVKVKYPFKDAMETDNLDATLNYAQLYEIIYREMRISSHLLEHVAGRIIRAIQTEFPLSEGGILSISKQKPPISGDIEGASVIVEW